MSCICGAPVNGSGPLCGRCAALAVLELKTGAREKEIRAAYRLMVKVWHPDRFAGDEPLRKAAEAKLKAINSAFQLLSSTGLADAPEPPASNPSAPHTPPPPVDPVKAAGNPPPAAADYQRAAAEARQASRAYQESARGPATGAARRGPQQARSRRASAYGARRAAAVPQAGRRSLLALRWLTLAFLLLLTRYVWIAFDMSGNEHNEAGTAGNAESQDVWQSLDLPKHRFVAAVKKDFDALGFRKIVPEAAAEGLEKASGSSRQSNLLRPGERPGTSPGSDAGSYITVGTTREEVVEQLGNPTRASQNVFVYDRSELYFRGDNVVGWRIDPASSPIKVKLWPRTFVDPDLNVFGAGSSKDEVLAIQGTPTALSEDKFEFGRSEVYFKNDQVVGWKNDLTSIPLHIEHK